VATRLGRVFGPMRAIERNNTMVPCWPRPCVGCEEQVLQPHSQYIRGAEPVCGRCRRAGVVARGKIIVSAVRAAVASFKDMDVTAPGARERMEAAAENEKAIWFGIKDRTTNQLSPDYPKYGGRGITMCEEWVDDFWAFYTFMGPRPSHRHSVGRKNNNLGYQPHDPVTGKVQCAWETPEEQARNQSHNRRIVWRGEEQLLVELAERIGITPVGLSARIAKYLAQALAALPGPATPEQHAALEAEAVERAMTTAVRRMKTSLGDREQEVVDEYLRTGKSARELADQFLVSQRAINSVLTRAGARAEYIRRSQELANTPRTAEQPANAAGEGGKS
jgi:hypothetical protein